MRKARARAHPDMWLVELTRAGSAANASRGRKMLMRVSAHRWPLLALVVLALALGCVTVLVMGSRARAVDYPDQWAPDVAPLVHVVERERGLRFDHPVYVDFLTPKRFLESSSPGDLDMVGQDHAAVDATARLLRALGIVGEDLDLYNESGQLRGTTVVLGYYSPVTHRIGLRGTELTPALEATLVHELAHALQDQHIDIAARQADLRTEPSRQLALRALLEGDADLVQASWLATLDDTARREVDADLAKQQLTPGGDSHVPPAVKSLVTAPDQLGGPLVSVVDRVGGQRALDDLLLTPPNTQEHLLDPWSLVNDHQGSLAVDSPPVQPGEIRFQQGTFGAVSWLVLLASRIDPEVALAAARGWGGDAFVAFEREGADCVRMTYAADTPADRQRMREALVAWTKRGPRSATRVVRSGQQLMFETCSSGPSPRPEHDRTKEALDLAVLHTTVSLELLEKGYDLTAARCGADRLVDRFATGGRAAVPARQKVVTRLMHPCLPDGTD